MKWICVFGAVLALSVNSVAAEHSCACADSCACEPSCLCEHPPRAPAGVMGDHVHHKGGWMVSTRFMAMYMEGGIDDDSSVSLPGRSMDVQKYMIGAMIAPHDRLTLAMMIPYAVKEMETPMMSARTEGVGDLKLTGIHQLWSTDAHQLLMNLSVGLPTGSIDEKNAAGIMRLGYPMQLGSGSWSLTPGITYTGRTSGWNWGTQAKANLPLHKNKHDYRLGNRYDLQGWISRDVCPESALSLRLNGWHRENIDGADPMLNPAMSPGNDPDLKAATRVDAWAGIDYRPTGAPGDARLVLEGGVPVYQYVDGPQLGTRWMVVAGAQLSF